MLPGAKDALKASSEAALGGVEFASDAPPADLSTATPPRGVNFWSIVRILSQALS